MISRNRLTSAVLVAATLLSNCALGGEPRAPSTRPFLLGFTRWPADLTLEGFLTAQNFAHEHGDIVSVMFIGGIPWPESLAGKPFSQDVENNLRYRPPAGKRLFLSISDVFGIMKFLRSVAAFSAPQPVAINRPENQIRVIQNILPFLILQVVFSLLKTLW